MQPFSRVNALIWGCASVTLPQASFCNRVVMWLVMCGKYWMCDLWYREQQHGLRLIYQQQDAQSRKRIQQTYTSLNQYLVVVELLTGDRNLPVKLWFTLRGFLIKLCFLNTPQKPHHNHMTLSCWLCANNLMCSVLYWS